MTQQRTVIAHGLTIEGRLVTLTDCGDGTLQVFSMPAGSSKFEIMEDGNAWDEFNARTVPESREQVASLAYEGPSA